MGRARTLERGRAILLVDFQIQKKWAAQPSTADSPSSVSRLQEGRLTWRERMSSSSMGGGDWESSFTSLPFGRFPSSPALPVPTRLTMAVAESSDFAGVHHKPRNDD